MSILITPADLGDPALAAFLVDHLADMEPTAPTESRHALDLSGLAAPGVRLWVAHDGPDLLGTVALAPVSGPRGDGDAGGGHEELKSMRTDPRWRGRGIGRLLLQHAVDDASARGVTRLSLETGSMDFFGAARALYRAHGFVDCPPFGDYRPDPNSVFLTRALGGPTGSG